jgi:dipeptidyl aminopeptidase/acylaminoacyl peptidase
MRRSTVLVFVMACSPAATPNGLCPSSSSAAAVSSAAPVVDAAPGSNYDKPPQNVLDAMLAPSPPVPVANREGDTLLMVSWVDYPPMTRVAEPFIRLGGLRLEPRTRARHDTPGGYQIAPCIRELAVVAVATGVETKVQLPRGCASTVMWSADGKHFALRNVEDAVELWLGDATTGQIHAVPNVRLNPMLGWTAQWMPDQKALLVKLVPDDAGPPPAAQTTPFAPNVQETTGEKGESSTYETRDTLQSKHDEDLFDYYGRSQLALVDASTGAVTKIGKPQIFNDVDVAPDGEHIRVAIIHKPYSYVTTFDRFAHDVAIWDRQGNAHPVASIPLADRVPVRGVRTGPRSFDWRANEPATLVWVEALDGGDWKTKVPARDKVLAQKAPFGSPAVEIMRTEQRYGGMSFGDRVALVYDYDDNRHWSRTYVLAVDDPNAKPSVLFDLSSDERYKDPGRAISKQLPNGQWVLRQEGDAIFLSGT